MRTTVMRVLFHMLHKFTVIMAGMNECDLLNKERKSFKREFFCC